MKNFHSPFKQFAVYFDHILGAKNRVVERVPLGIPNSEFSWIYRFLSSHFWVPKIFFWGPPKKLFLPKDLKKKKFRALQVKFD